MTQCTQRTFEFQGVGRREVTAKFDAPALTSDAGGLLLRELEAKPGLVELFSQSFSDFRDPRYTTHQPFGR